MNQRNTEVSSHANAGANPTAANNNTAAEARQRLWVKEQEINALKIQNRHLLAKLEDAEKKARPDPITSEQISAEVQQNLQPLIRQVDQSLVSSFEMIQGTLKGIYQQSHRAQEVVEEMTAHVKTVETRMMEQRKADQLYYQEKIFTTISSFCDRIERQIDHRLKALSSIEIMNAKQNEMLSDLEDLRGMMNEMQLQGRNLEEMSRDSLRRARVESAQQSAARTAREARDKEAAVAEMEMRENEILNSTAPAKKEVEVKSVPMNAASVSNVISPEEEMINLQSAIQAGELDASNEDLTLVLEMMKAQKDDLKTVAKKSTNFLKRTMFSGNKNKEKNPEQVAAAPDLHVVPNEDYQPSSNDVTELRIE